LVPFSAIRPPVPTRDFSQSFQYYFLLWWKLLCANDPLY
jgi:hypothetical protein